MTETEIQSSKVEKLVNREINITNEMFVKAQDKKAYSFPESEKTRIKTKLYQEYNNYKEYVPLPKRVKSEESAPSVGNVPAPSAPLSMDLPFQLPFETDENKESNKRNIVNEVLNEINQKEFEEDNKNKVGLIPYKPMENNQIVPLEGESSDVSRALVSLRHASVPVPEWHAPWKLHKVLVGHQGWVDCVAVDVSNEWFATGSDDRTVKIWNLATGKLIMTLTGHSHTVKSIAISARSPYMFTASEDKSIKCWDLETNKVIRSYNEHLNGVYSLALHPSLDILFSGGRDSVCRVWDIRTKTNIATLGGHKGSIFSIITQDAEPQVITGSMDTTIRLWDLAEMSTSTILTHHKKAVRSLLFHPIEYTFASAGADNIKRWKCPNGEFLNNISGHKGILNTISLNQNNVLFAGSNNGQLRFYDWKSGYCFDEKQTPLQPGSIDADASILASTFDKTGTRLITCEGDKTIKIYKEDVNATEETHPIDMEKWKVEWRSRRSIY